MIKYILIICAAFAICYCMDFYIKSIRTDVSALSKYMLFLGLGCALWELGYAFTDFYRRPYIMVYYEKTALVGAAAMIATEFLLYFMWLRNHAGERSVVMKRSILMSMFLMVAACMLRLYYPFSVTGIAVCSPFLCTLAFWIVVYAANSYRNFHTSAKTLGKYIYDNGNIGFLSFSGNGRLIVLNETAKQIVGISESDALRLIDIFDLNSMSEPEFLEKVRTESESEYHLTAKRTDKVCSTSFREIKDAFGETNFFICAIYDRSKEEEILESIRKSGDAKSNFLASMTHEIRTPINAILGMREMIERESTSEEILGYSRSMEKAGEHLLAIVNDVLDYSKIQSGMLNLIPVRYDLRELFHKLIIRYKQKIVQKGIAFTYSIHEELPAYLYGDEVRIHQILKNLLSNAYKYTDKGTISFTAYARKESEERVTLIIEVKDTGKGIKKEDQENLFDLFIRADHEKNQTIAGTGIGLAIVSNLISMMGGTISVESEYGKGSCFKVEIPQKVVSYHQIGDYEKSLVEYSAEQTSNLQYEYTAPAAAVLIVDDNSVNLSVARFLLEKTETKVDVASSGKEAIEKIKESSYQIIFLDHIMPEMDGVETIKKIREEHLADDVPIIALTANDVAGAKEMYLDYGFQDYLSKPIGKGSLEKKIYDWLPKNYIHYNDVPGNGTDNQEASDISICKLPSNYKGKVSLEEYSYEDDRLNNQLTHIFVINPIATGDKTIREIRNYLEQTKSMRYFIFTTNSQGSETELIRRIQHYFANEHLRIYCIGGSGTIRNVLNGIEDFDRVEIAVCPLGMTNDFMKAFGSDQEKFKDLSKLIYGEVKKIDYIQTTYGISLNTFSLGLDANIVMHLNRNRILSIFGKLFPYITAFFYSLLITTADEYEFYLDGELVYEGLSTEIMFGNGNVLGGLLQFGKKQKITDGKGCVMIVKKRQGLALLSTIIAMARGDMDRISRTELVREASSVKIRRRDGGSLAMNFDGEMEYGTDQCEARIVKQGLKFVVPMGVSVDGQ